MVQDVHVLSIDPRCPLFGDPGMKGLDYLDDLDRGGEA